MHAQYSLFWTWTKPWSTHGISHAQGIPTYQKQNHILKSSIFWDVTSWSMLKVKQCFEETRCPHLPCWRVTQARKQQHEVRSKWLQHCIPEETELLITAVRISNPTKSHIVIWDTVLRYNKLLTLSFPILYQPCQKLDRGPLLIFRQLPK
jgi:hypothetical protein